MPPEHVRLVMREHGDMTAKKWQSDKAATICALRYIPHAILKLFETMPMPWEPARTVSTLYHTAGAVTIVSETPRVVPPHFIAQWACMWVAIRREKRDRRHFRRMNFPPFDDEEPPVDFVEAVLPHAPLDPIRLTLSPDEDAAVYDWFYDYRPPPPMVRGAVWDLPLEVRAVLARFAMVVTTQLVDPNYSHLFETKAFITAKSLGLAIPSGPKFEPLFRDCAPGDEDWNEFTDLAKVIVRVPLRTEAQVAYPQLYNPRPRRTVHAVYHHPSCVYVRQADLTEPPFVCADVIHPVLKAQCAGSGLFDPPAGLAAEEVGAWSLPEGVAVPLEAWEADEAAVANGISLLWSPWPMCSRQGRLKRPIDISVVGGWMAERCPVTEKVKVRVSCQKLLKLHVLNHLHRKPLASERRRTFAPSRVSRRRGLLAALSAHTGYFHRTELDWVEAGLQLCRQGHNALNLLIHRRGLTYLHLDYNFNLKPTKTLTTKERKRSRFGHAFHLTRELLRLMKLVVDAHVQHRVGTIDAFQLADGLHYIFCHVGVLTGAYRFKYRIMRQIRATKDIKHLVHSRLNTGPVQTGPGCGYWIGVWRVWVFLLRGVAPILERWLGNLLARNFEGRAAKQARKVTAQRADANYDLELRARVFADIIDKMPEGMRAAKARTMGQHLSEAWRCWKANIPWRVPGMPAAVENIVVRYVRAKADYWMNSTYYNRERVRRGATVDKNVFQKNTGRMTRLALRAEHERQAAFLKDGPYLTNDEAVAMYSAMVAWLQGRRFVPIPFPSITYRHDTKLLVLALERLKEAFVSRVRMNTVQRDELGLVEMAYDNPNDALARVKRHLLVQRTFHEVEIAFTDLFTQLIPRYVIDPLEKITDSYVDQYVWYEADRRGLFPPWAKPGDSEPVPILVHKMAAAINDVSGVWDTADGGATVVVDAKLDALMDRVDLTVLNFLLRLVVDHNIADYMTAKCNVSISFKDMTHTNNCGVIRALQFAGFLAQFWGLAADLLAIGVSRAAELAGPPTAPHDFGPPPDPLVECAHPVRVYMRHYDRLYVVLRFSGAEVREVTARYLAEHPDPGHEHVAGFRSRVCWPRDARMRLLRADVHLARAAFWQLRNRLPAAIFSLVWDDSWVSVYSAENPAAHFSLEGFEVRILPTTRGRPPEGDAVWPLAKRRTHEVTAHAMVRMSRDAVQRFDFRVRLILMYSASATFAKIGGKWNSALTAMLAFFREAVTATPEVLDLLIKAESKVQTRIKLGLNSKMPSRFPPVVFYSPKELGGLGMLSIGHILIPAQDVRYSRIAADGGAVEFFRQGMSHEEGATVPNVYRYIIPWRAEVADSVRVWADFAVRREESLATGRRVMIEDIESVFDRGVPRIHTLFAKDRNTIAFDRGFRMRSFLSQHTAFRPSLFSWTINRHDGALWSLRNYKVDVIQAFGGVEGILEHTLFKGTYFPTWEGLFWEKTTTFEDAMQYKKLTHAQRSGLHQIPNRRFALWWSPTLNRANVYIGFAVQLDLTGVLMHGKLPMLKIALIQIFRAHLWQKIHESVVMDLCQALMGKSEALGIESVQKEAIHPRKSYKLNASCADIILFPSTRWSFSIPSLLTETLRDDVKAAGDARGDKQQRYWIDVQLRWGDYDGHDAARYARAKFLDYTQDPASKYPSHTGVVVAIDLAYNEYAAFGHWVPHMRQPFADALAKIVRYNPALYVLRERIRKGVQLYCSEPTEAFLSSTNYMDMFGEKPTFIVDDTQVYRVSMHRTLEGNMATKPLNGALMVFVPKTGEMYVKIIHARTWAGQKRLSQLARWKAAEEVAALLRFLPPEQLPSQVVAMKSAMMDPLEVHMLDFPNVVLKGSDLHLPLNMALRLPGLGDVVSAATESRMLLYKMYDDWPAQQSPYTCFSRLILLLRAMHVQFELCMQILRPSADKTVVHAHHLWPTLTDDEWIAVETALKDLILGDYAKKNGVAVSSLTQSEVRDILLGMEVTAPQIQKKLREDVEKSARDAATAKAAASAAGGAKDGATTAVMSRTVNRLGEVLTTVTSSPYEQATFSSRSDWRVRALAASNLGLRARTVVVPPVDARDFGGRAPTTVVLPHNVIAKLVACADLRTVVGGIIYGSPAAPTDAPRAATAAELREVRAVVFPPQWGTHAYVNFPTGTKVPDHDALAPLKPLGWIRTSTSQHEGVELTGHDIVAHARLIEANGWEVASSVIITAALTPGSVTLLAWVVTTDGMEWAVKNMDAPGAVPCTRACYAPAAVVVSSSFVAGFLSPEAGDNELTWNYNFASASHTATIAYTLALSPPLPFYHEAHRALHFLQFAGAGGGTDLVRGAGVEDDDLLS